MTGIESTVDLGALGIVTYETLPIRAAKELTSPPLGFGARHITLSFL
jgi:hypothetical protein